MRDTPEAHRLGAHVVGTRVVVRRVVRGETGPTGGPAMTDILGVCTAWGEGRCIVQPAEGEPVTIALGDIVSGKPVPPRPSVRHRVSPRDVQIHTRALWPELEVEPLGDWLLRAAPPEDGRRLRRANSVLAMGDRGVPLDDAQARIMEFYAARGQDPLAQVESDGPVEEELLAAGWSPLGSGEAACLLASTGRALRAATGGPEPEVEYAEDGPRIRVATVDGVAAGRAAVDGDWVGVHDVRVDPDHRRQGLATAIMAALLDHGAAQGALTAWLHVELDNPAALALYEGLGFREHHRYRYMAPEG